MKCEHCSRGEAQNIDMTDEILFKSLDNLYTIEDFTKSNGKKYNDRIYLYGGEPFLCPESIHKCVDYILENNIFITRFCAVTNGAVLSDEIAKDFQKIYSHVKNCRELFRRKNKNLSLLKSEVCIYISYNYHNEEQSEKAYNFYNKYQNIQVKYFDIDDKYNKVLAYSGRAKNLITKKDIYFSIRNNHCMATNIEEDYVEKTITVSANGNVFLGLMYEYSYVDEDNMGNVLNETIYDMVIKWNYNNPMKQEEMSTYREIKSFLFNYKNGFDFNNKKVINTDEITDKLIEYQNSRICIYDTLVNERKKLHKEYESLPIKDILYFGDLMLELYSNGNYICNFYDKKQIGDYDFESKKYRIIEEIERLKMKNNFI